MEIQVEHLTKTYGATLAVDDLTFDIEKGRIVGFLGPNGAGKSTTMRILTGFIPASSGTAQVAGHDVFSDSLAARAAIGYVPEGMPLYPEMRVTEYLTFRARLKGVPRAVRRQRLDMAMDIAGITAVQRQLIGSLSKGYRQRVGLAEALLHDPRVLILDEPTIGLDPNQIRQVRQAIKNLGGDHTVLLSTHILSEVEMVCEQVLIIHNGRLAFAGSVRNLGESDAALHVCVRGPGQAVLAALNSLPGVVQATWDGLAPIGGFEVMADRGRDVREDVFRCVVAHDWTLLEMRRTRETLEDLFVHLTAREGN